MIEVDLRELWGLSLIDTLTLKTPSEVLLLTHLQVVLKNKGYSLIPNYKILPILKTAPEYSYYINKQGVFTTGELDTRKYEPSRVNIEKKESKFATFYHYNSDMLGVYNISSTYIYLLAQALVDRYLANVRWDSFMFAIDKKKVYQKEFVDLYVLLYFGNRLFDVYWFRLPEYKSTDNHYTPIWEAYMYINHQLGFNTQRSKKTKYTHLVNTYKRGDILFYYKLNKASSASSYMYPVMCYPAIIKDITQDVITITYFTILESKVHRSKLLEEAEKEIGKEVFTVSDYNKFPSFELKLKINDIGVDMYHYNEEFILMHPLPSYEKFKQWVYRDDTLLLVEEEFSPLELVYHVLDDRGVDYNKVTREGGISLASSK